MSNKPLVSIVLPTYNRAQLLSRAVRSVLRQQYEELELIIIDDGSTDNTPAVVAAIQDPRIHYLRFEENVGIGAARREGVDCARGRLIAFIDSDDLWLPGKLELQVYLFAEYLHLDLIFGNYVNINHITGTQELGFDKTRMSLERLIDSPLENGVWEILSGFQRAMLERSFMATPTVMVKKEAARMAGNFDKNLSAAEDFEFWWRLAAHGAHFAYTEQPLIERHKDNQSMTAQTIRVAPDRLRALELCEQTSLKCGQRDLLPALRKAKHRTWCGLVREYGLLGEELHAVRAFAQALRYGFSWVACYELLGALAGIRVASRVRALVRRMKLHRREL